MKKIYLTLTAIIIASVALFSQRSTTITGNGKNITQQRAVSSFNEINVSGGMQVVVTQAGTAQVKVQADENLQEYIITEVQGTKLNIKYKDKVSIKGGNVKVYVALPQLNGAGISGSGNITGDQVISSGGSFKSSISGSGGIRLKTTANSIEARISGSGNIELGGTTNDLEVVISGSGSFKGYNLKAKDAAVTISGSGNVETNVDGPLDAKISGSGSVYYKGNADISLKSSGSGKIKRAE